MTLLTRGGYALPGTSLDFETGTWRVQKPVHQHRPAPCHTACPAGEDAQEYLARIEEGNLQRAWEALVQANPLPAVTGRVCPHPCESGCNRGRYDEPIAIHAVERYLGDQAIQQGWAYPVTQPRADAKTVAVVGAGPAGLSAAYHLTRLGYRVTLFDRLPQTGGTLRTAIPTYRLPREVLDAETERVIAVGIQFLPHHRLGRDMSLRELRQQYGAVFLGPGHQLSEEWSVDGAVPADLHSGLDLLREWVAVGTVPSPSSAAIIGGGNTAVDIARVLKRAGATQVHVITHYALPGKGVDPADVMGAAPRDVAQAIEEGVKFHQHRGIQRLILRGERVVGLEMVHMRKLSSSDGRQKRTPFAGTETVLHVDQVIPAVGQRLDPGGMEDIVRDRHFLNTDECCGLRGHPGVFAGGDVCHSSGTVAAAVGDGRRAAQGIDRFLRGLPAPAPEAREPIGIESLNLHYYEHGQRPEDPILPVEQRIGCQEIEGSLRHSQIAAESRRCFSCGTCFSCDNCWTLCPDEAVLKSVELAPDGSHYVFDYDYCKGCGLCAHECPCGYIGMVED